MTQSSFAGVTFQVAGRSNRFPTPAADDDLIWRWRGEVRFFSKSARNAMADKLSYVTVKRPIGSTSSNIHIDAGYGSGALSVPTQAGTLGSYTAVLTGFTDGGADGQKNTIHWATLEFTISGDATP